MHKIIHIVSLKEATERRKHINKMFSKLSLDFIFFDAINKLNLEDVLSKYEIKFKEGSLTKGEMGCFMSHYLLWKKLIKTDMPYMIIGEDDMVISNNIQQMINNLDNIMQRCDVFKFETMKMPVIMYKSSKTYDLTFSMKRLKQPHWGTAGYVISKKLAKELCTRFENIEISKPIDHCLFEDLLETYNICQSIPAFSIQDDVLNGRDSAFHSVLESERRKRMSSGKVQYKNKFIREVSRLFKQISLSFWKEKRAKYILKKHSLIVPFFDER